MKKKPQILVVDDVAANRLAVRRVLKSLDVEVIEVDSGNAALQASFQYEDIALVLLDIQMPEIDGFEVAEILREEPSTKHIPIIFLTAIHQDDKHKLHGYQVGAIDYLSKPIIPYILCAKVKLFAELWQIRKDLKAELTHSNKVEEELRFLSRHDALTGLPNRVQLISDIEHAIERVNRYGHNLALLFLDLDGFKQANDTYGHEAGDAVLVEVANRLKKFSRNTDTVSRLGGDEFVILLTDLQTVDYCQPKCEQFIKAVNEPFVWGRHLLSLGVSIGCGTYGQGDYVGVDAKLICKDLLKRADIAMYEAKKSGKNDFKLALPRAQSKTA